MAGPAYTIVADDFNLANSEVDVTIYMEFNFGTYAGPGGVPFAVANVNAALLAAGHKAHETISAIKSVVPGSMSHDGTVRPSWDEANAKMKAFNNGVASANGVVDSPSLTLDGSKLSEALPAGCVAVLGGRSSGGTAGVIKLVGDNPANTLEARYIPASRKVQLLAADANTGLQVQYLTHTPSAPLPVEYANATDLSAAAKTVSLLIRATRS